MTLNEDEFGLMSEKKRHCKYDIIEKDIWIGNTGASTHTSSSNEGMINCQETVNQYIKEGSGERLQIMKKGCKRCTIVQQNGTWLHVVLDNDYYILKLWCNLFSILEAFKRGWSIRNKWMHITISKGRSTLNLIDCPSALQDI